MSRRSGRARIRASGSSADSSPSPQGPRSYSSSSVDRPRSLDVLHLFPAPGSAGRRLASLHRVLRGEFPCFADTIKALRLPAARPAALRCLRPAVPPRPLVLSLPGGRVRRRGPELLTRSPARDSTEETTGSPRFLGNPDCPFARVSRRRQDREHQTIAVPRHGPWYPKSKGSHERSFGAP